MVSPVPVTLVDWAGPAESVSFTRALNEGLAEVSAGSGGRLLALGTVPLPHVDAAVDELGRLRGLGLVGIELPAFPGGMEFDDARLAPFWSAVEAERIPVLVHPPTRP